MLKATSNFFTAMLDGQFREASENLVKLPEADAEIFSIYVQALYSKEISVLDVSSDMIPNAD